MEESIAHVLTTNTNLFAWSADMSRIKPKFHCHKLVIFLRLDMLHKGRGNSAWKGEKFWMKRQLFGLVTNGKFRVFMCSELICIDRVLLCLRRERDSRRRTWTWSVSNFNCFLILVNFFAYNLWSLWLCLHRRIVILRRTWTSVSIAFEFCLIFLFIIREKSNCSV